jgi:hypothetical protein
MLQVNMTIHSWSLLSSYMCALLCERFCRGNCVLRVAARILVLHAHHDFTERVFANKLKVDFHNNNAFQSA